MKNILNAHQSIIFLNGSLPDKKIMPLLNMNVPLIAADGAAHTMQEVWQLTPTYVIGDGDSYHQSPSSSTVIKIEDQNSTDFEKCILFAQKQNLLPALVLGINGGEIDHSIGNAQAFLKHAQDFNLYFLDTYIKKDKTVGIKLGIPLTNKKLTINVQKNSIVSVISFHNAIIQSHGLYWELNDYELCIDHQGTRNINIADLVEFEVKEGKVLLIIDISYWNRYL